MNILDLIILFSLGSLGGLLAGLLGIGGGIVYVLIFTHYLESIGTPSDIIVPAIVANSMFAIMFAGLSGTYKQWRNNNFFPKEIALIGLTASCTSIVFSYLISLGNWYRKEHFTLLFILLLIYIAWKIFRSANIQVKEQLEKKSTGKLFLAGSISGSIAAFSGIGGGVIIVPFLTNLMRMPIKKATSISLGVISVMALNTSVFNAFFQKNPNITTNNNHWGLLFFQLALPVALGSLIFSPIGVNLSSRLKPSAIRIIFAIFLMIVIIKMLYGLI